MSSFQQRFEHDAAKIKRMEQSSYDSEEDFEDSKSELYPEPNELTHEPTRETTGETTDETTSDTMSDTTGDEEDKYHQYEIREQKLSKDDGTQTFHLDSSGDAYRARSLVQNFCKENGCRISHRCCFGSGYCIRKT